jgi:signal transduction histidine kinase
MPRKTVRQLEQEVRQLQETILLLQRSPDDRPRRDADQREGTSGGQSATEDKLWHERARLKQMLDLQERDRKLIAYEIHDGLVQDMTAALMHLQASRHKAHTDGARPSESVEDLDVATRLLQRAIAEARRLINDLRPPNLDDGALVPAIEHLIDDVQRLSSLSVAFVHDVPAAAIAPALQNVVFRIIQEALTNVHRHSGARRAEVELIHREGRLQIVVRDRGRGFTPQNVPPARYGLLGLQDRARLFGGHARIESAPGKGTTITVDLPLTDALAEAD